MGDLNSIMCMNEDLEILILQEPLPSAMHLIIERVSPLLVWIMMVLLLTLGQISNLVLIPLSSTLTDI